jgi:hypothetical protein
MSDTLNSLIAQGVPPPPDPNAAYYRLNQMIRNDQAGQLQLEQAKRENQVGQMQLKQAQQDFQDQQTMRQAYMQSGGDMDKFQQLVMQRGVSPKAIQQIQMQRLTMQKELAGLDETKLKNEKAKNDAFGSESAALLQITDPDKRQQYYQQVTKPRLTQMGVQVPGTLPAGDEFLQLHANSAKTGDQLFNEELKRRENERAAALAVPQLEKAKAEALSAGLGSAAQTVGPIANQDQYTAWRAGLPASVQARIPPMFSPAAVEMVQRMGVPVKEQPEYDIKARQAQAMSNMKPEDWDAQVDNAIAPNGDTQQLNARTKALVRGAIGMGLPLTAVQAVIKDASDQIGRTETGVRTAKATAPIKIQVAGAQAAARTPTPSTDALDLMAENALAGTMPSSRNPVLYSRVMDRAAQLAKERGLTAQQTVMERNAAQANKAALNAVTKQYETLKPFADMAEKNADILEQKAAAVTNLGGSFWNTPVRELQSRFAGNTAVAAYTAALLPVQADFARILNSPTGSGVLSDHAREEMRGALKPGATAGEIKAALDVFRQDAKNRRESYEAELSDLKSRTVAGSTSRTGTGEVKPTHRFNPATGKIEEVKK